VVPPTGDRRLLESFGVDSDSELVYLALLRRPGERIEHVAQCLAMDPSSVREAIGRLARLGLVRSSSDLPEAVRAVSPEIGLESVLARQEAELAGRRSRIDEGRAALAVLLADREREDHTVRASYGAQAEEVFGVDAVRQRLEQLTYVARFEVLSASPGGVEVADLLEEDRLLDDFLLRKGVAVRTVYQASIRNVPPASAYAEWVAQRGGQIRTLPTLPLRMKVIDRRTAALLRVPEGGGTALTVLRHPAALVAIHALFERMWDEAVPFAAPEHHIDASAVQQQMALLRLLADGATDEIAARKLSVSVRTVGRMVSELMSRLGARSRFQAGILVGRHGWLEKPPKDGAPH